MVNTCLCFTKLRVVFTCKNLQVVQLYCAALCLITDSTVILHCIVPDYR